MEWIGDLERTFASVIYPNRVIVGVLTVVLVVALVVVALRRGWVASTRRHPRRAAVILIPGLVIALPLAWYVASPLVLSKSIDEPAPIVSGGGTATTPTVSPTSSATPATFPSASATEPPSPSPSATPLARSGTFSGADDFHFGRGTAHLVETSPGVFVVRLADFEVRNGPDLFVYLSPSAEGYAKGVVELGALKADKGNQNYEVPLGVDPTSARSVVIWCKQFSVLFATAPLGS